MKLTRFNERPASQTAENWALLAEAVIDSYADQVKVLAAQAESQRIIHQLDLATHACTECAALWIRDQAGNWSLVSHQAGACCNAVAMGPQMKAIGLTARIEELEAAGPARIKALEEALRIASRYLTQVVEQRPPSEGSIEDFLDSDVFQSLPKPEKKKS